MLKRAFDLIAVLFAGILLSPFILLSYILVKLSSPGPVIYWSQRVGRNNQLFSMPKFRSMKINTPAVATHLLDRPENYLTPVGRFIRKTSLDELPQLWSIWVGDMSFVGPRPALFNQADLIGMRTRLGIEVLTPGLTGWAQVNGRDDLDIATKVDFDYQYLRHQSLMFDFQILWLTFLKVVHSEGVIH